MEFKTISPVDGSIYAERPYSTAAEISDVFTSARRAQLEWRTTTVAERANLCLRFVEHFVDNTTQIAEEITWQMGRPVAHTPGEVRRLEERVRYMVSIAEESLSDIDPGLKAGFSRRIRREPLGVVLTLAPWNYPLVTAVNSIVPAIMAGNAVILKHSEQTPLCADRFLEAFDAAGLPHGVFQILFADHPATGALIATQDIDFVSFTGSVEGGRAVQRAAASRFIGVGLELGGKDPAYVRPDAPLAFAAENIADGAFYNAGQSCCSVERIYVHEAIYDRFVDAFAEEARKLRLGNPLDPETTLGPLVRTKAADTVRAHIRDAESRGAKCLVDAAEFPDSKEGTPYHQPQVLVGVDHSMRIMREETFGPVAGIMKVASDEEAVQLMNDTNFGLTASIWTADEDAAVALGDRIQTGTLYVNRCDFVDAALAWTGVKDSGRGCSLSRVGYEHLTRPKSFHIRQLL